ncbi:L,D-transpeptidase [Amorphus orientalis]|uniref:Lipoprotein-anchoring transpeptidase ErfK/SrfK n=1 Tax=Amorphus orientalis TaxID=649198 RepID=A0AAE3VP33_9HYPH|nr:L,D-transpeptidase [Amorphus orientalis]MDQ0315601.1 lipoprotein-anchoring transpeptidase ErfK/SrfK [Amorphus orientalis]
MLVAGLLVAAAWTMALSDATAATVTATIDLSDQRMYVSVGKKHIHTWPVSTARKGYRTPTGSFRPTRMYRRYYSRKYNNSPMPNSIFFYGGYAIHGTTAIKSLGRPASHGCIRLHPSNAKALYDLVNANGPGNTRIRIRW